MAVQWLYFLRLDGREYRVYGGGVIVLSSLEQVAVSVDRNIDPGVSQHAGHGMDVLSFRKVKTSGGMPQSV